MPRASPLQYSRRPAAAKRRRLPKLRRGGGSTNAFSLPPPHLKSSSYEYMTNPALYSFSQGSMVWPQDTRPSGNQSPVSRSPFSGESLPWITLRPTWGQGLYEGATGERRLPSEDSARCYWGCRCRTGRRNNVRLSGTRIASRVPGRPCAHLDRKVAADGARLRDQRVGRADELARRRDDAVALPHLRRMARAAVEQAQGSGLWMQLLLAGVRAAAAQRQHGGCKQLILCASHHCRRLLVT